MNNLKVDWQVEKIDGVICHTRPVPGNDLTGFEDELIQQLEMIPSGKGWISPNGEIIMIFDEYKGRYMVITQSAIQANKVDGVIYG